MKSSADAKPKGNCCLSGVIRGLLCTGSLPTHPSDQFVESNKKNIDDPTSGKCLKTEAAVEKLASPGVVAKLMGLDSFPNSPLTPKHRTNLGSYFRSRSVNSIDFLTHFDPSVKKGHHQHRRVRTSVSFREGVSDDCGLILHLEKVDEKEEYREELIIERRPEVNYQQSEREKRERSKKNENLKETNVSARKFGKSLEVVEERRRSACVQSSSETAKKDIRGRKGLSLKEKRPVIKPANCKESLVESKCKLRKKKKKNLGQNKVHSQCSLTKVHPAEAILSEEAPAVSSRKFLPSQIANCESQSPCSSGPHSDDGDLENKGPKGKSESWKRENKERCNYKRMAENICRLTEEDLKENWTHGMALNFQNSEEICLEFGHGILQSLLEQLVDELVLLHETRIQ